MEALVKGPLMLPWPAAAKGAGTEGRQRQAQGPGRVPCVHALAGGFDVTFPSRHLPAWDTSGAGGPQGTGGT